VSLAEVRRRPAPERRIGGWGAKAPCAWASNRWLRCEGVLRLSLESVAEVRRRPAPEPRIGGWGAKAPCAWASKPG